MIKIINKLNITKVNDYIEKCFPKEYALKNNFKNGWYVNNFLYGLFKDCLISHFGSDCLLNDKKLLETEVDDLPYEHNLTPNEVEYLSDILLEDINLLDETITGFTVLPQSLEINNFNFDTGETLIENFPIIILETN